MDEKDRDRETVGENERLRKTKGDRDWRETDSQTNRETETQSQREIERDLYLNTEFHQFTMLFMKALIIVK